MASHPIRSKPCTKALSDAIEAQELTRLRALLGEILLKGWPKRILGTNEPQKRDTEILVQIAGPHYVPTKDLVWKRKIVQTPLVHRVSLFKMIKTQTHMRSFDAVSPTPNWQISDTPMGSRLEVLQTLKPSSEGFPLAVASLS